MARNIQEFVSYYRTLKKAAPSHASDALTWPKTIVNFTPMIVNVRETPDMVDLIADWGVEALFVQKFSLNNAYTGSNWAPEINPELMNRVYDEAVCRAERRGVMLIIEDRIRHAPATMTLPAKPPEMPHVGCTRPFSDAIIMLDGSVYPCCFGAPPLGFLQCQSFDEIWNGEAWRELRRGLTEGDPPAYCRKCHLLKRPDSEHKPQIFQPIRHHRGSPRSAAR